MVIGISFSTIFGIALVSFAVGLFFGIIAGASLPTSEKKEKENKQDDR